MFADSRAGIVPKTKKGDIYIYIYIYIVVQESIFLYKQMKQTNSTERLSSAGCKWCTVWNANI